LNFRRTRLWKEEGEILEAYQWLVTPAKIKRKKKEVW